VDGLTLSRQLPISLTCISKMLAPKLDLQTREIMLELFTADPSHNAGSTAATVDNSPHLATFCAINAKSQELQQNPAARTVGLNSLEPRRETATWHTRSASNDETHRIRPIFLYFCESFTFICIALLEYHIFGVFGVFGRSIRGIRKIR
jgi:hypothetical protein